jgi:hypothetical protein
MKSLTLLCLALLLLSTGCTTKREVYAGYQPDVVWTAMLAVAETPDYTRGEPADRWFVRENRIWVDPDMNRIEIFRRLDRVLYQPASRPVRQDRTWKFQVMLEEHDPPTVMFRARNLGVPGHAWLEAERYFAEVREILTAERLDVVETAARIPSP